VSRIKRFLFSRSEPPQDRLYLDTIRRIEQLCLHLQDCIAQGQDPDLKFKWIEVRARGFLRSLAELEESKYGSELYGRNVQKTYLEEMTEEERLDYYRHVYFYKNSFIRLFSILDKLGYLLNDYYRLGTETVKPQFSYFTVLRRLAQTGAHSLLQQELRVIKEKYEAPLQRLRKQRNMEIHFLNSEDRDDLLQWDEEKIRLENITGNLQDLQSGYEMVCRSMCAAFRWMLRDCPLPGA
jgi:hypothetical protein